MRQFDASLRALQEHNNCDPGDSMRYPQDLKDRDDARRRTDCSVTNGELYLLFLVRFTVCFVRSQLFE